MKLTDEQKQAIENILWKLTIENRGTIDSASQEIIDIVEAAND